MPSWFLQLCLCSVVPHNICNLIMYRGNRYEPGDSILITDIGPHHGDAGPGDSLVCVTTDVNTQCCTDVGGVGEWLFPNGSMVLNYDDPNRNSQIIRTGRANQVALLLSAI